MVLKRRECCFLVGMLLEKKYDTAASGIGAKPISRCFQTSRVLVMTFEYTAVETQNRCCHFGSMFADENLNWAVFPLLSPPLADLLTKVV